MNYTVSVVLTFPVSRPKAEEVLETWWKRKDHIKQYMREYRKGKRRTSDDNHEKVGGAFVGSAGNNAR